MGKRYIIEYWRDMTALKARAFNFHPKTTNYVDEIISYIKELEEKGYAYKAENGDVYFEVGKFLRYGELSHRKIEDLKVGIRVEVSEYKKILWTSPSGNLQKKGNRFGKVHGEKVARDGI